MRVGRRWGYRHVFGINGGGRFAFASPSGIADTRFGLTSLTRRDGAVSRTDYAAWLRKFSIVLVVLLNNGRPRHN
jgi:hypothetical protein